LGTGSGCSLAEVHDPVLLFVWRSWQEGARFDIENAVKTARIKGETYA
jgi:hypothetical protein